MILAAIPHFLLAVVLHEYAHGWVANKFGDPTARLAGRLTLNPLVHIDPVGTVFLPLMMIVFGALAGVRPFIIGWAKPVPVNFALLRNPRRGVFWVSIAGITANLLLAFCFSLLLRTGIFALNTYGALFLSYGIFINLLLAVFNAIPIPPLDGSKAVLNLLPKNMVYSYLALERYGLLIIIGLFYLGFWDRVILPIVLLLAQIFGVRL